MIIFKLQCIAKLTVKPIRWVLQKADNWNTVLVDVVTYSFNPYQQHHTGPP